MAPDQFIRAAEMWNEGKDTFEIGRALVFHQFFICQHLERIKAIARELRAMGFLSTATA